MNVVFIPKCRRRCRRRAAAPWRAYRSRPAVVDAGGLGLGNALKLAFPAQVGVRSPAAPSSLPQYRQFNASFPVESRFVFMTERVAPITTAGYRKMISRTGESGEFPFPVHPHMLRHACGYKLANDGQDTRAVQKIPKTAVLRLISQRDKSPTSMGSEACSCF